MTNAHSQAQRAQIVRFISSSTGAVVLTALLAGQVGCSSNDGTSPSQVVATVDGQEVTESQVGRLLEQQPNLKPDQMDAAGHKVVSGLVDQEIVLQKARALKVDRDPQVVQGIESMKRDIIVKAYLQRIADGAERPVASEVQTYYDANPALFAQRRIYTFHEVSMAVSGAQKKAIEAQLAAMKSPADLESYLNAQGIAAKAKQSVIAAENVPLSMLKRLAALDPGQGLIVAGDGGLRVLQLLSTQDRPISLEQARSAIAVYLLKQRQEQAVQRELVSLREVVKVEYFGKYADLAASASARSVGAAPSATELAPLATAPTGATTGPQASAHPG